MMKTKIYKSYDHFLKRKDKSINGVSASFAKNNPHYKEDNNTNEGCWNCRACSSCSDCSDCREIIGNLVIPIIKNIHSKVLEAVKNEGNTLDMGNWHTCNTTHCRAGWVVHLAGNEGYELEKLTDTSFAAMQIYKNSSTIYVGPNKFFEENAEAMQDIERCARLEKESS